MCSLRFQCHGFDSEHYRVHTRVFLVICCRLLLISHSAHEKCVNVLAFLWNWKNKRNEDEEREIEIEFYENEIVIYRGRDPIKCQIIMDRLFVCYHNLLLYTHIEYFPFLSFSSYFNLIRHHTFGAVKVNTCAYLSIFRWLILAGICVWDTWMACYVVCCTRVSVYKCVCVCMCVRNRERERTENKNNEKKRQNIFSWLSG